MIHVFPTGPFFKDMLIFMGVVVHEVWVGHI